MRSSTKALIGFGVLGAGVGVGASAATTVTFEGVAPGSEVTSLPGGISVSAVNPNRPFDRVLGWDYQNQPEHIPGGHQNDVYDIGLILEGEQPGVFEKAHPAGHFVFDFTIPLTDFGVTVVDVDGPEEFATDTGSFLRFYSGGTLVGHVEYADFGDPSSDYYDPTISFGNGSIVTTRVFNAGELGTASSFDRVSVALGGSASVAAVTYQPVPTPTAALAGAALLGGAMLRRRAVG